jgi:hypothetical protein
MTAPTYRTPCPRCTEFLLTIEEYEVGPGGTEVTLIPDEPSMDHLHACKPRPRPDTTETQ